MLQYLCYQLIITYIRKTQKWRIKIVQLITYSLFLKNYKTSQTPQILVLFKEYCENIIFSEISLDLIITQQYLCIRNSRKELLFKKLQNLK